MIVKVFKYTLVAHHGNHEEFLEKLQTLGVVDITTTGWEADEVEHATLNAIEQHDKAAELFKTLAKGDNFVIGEPFESGDIAFAHYLESVSKIETLTGQIAKTQKEIEELNLWGKFAPEKLAGLAQGGITLHFYSCYTTEFNSNSARWSEEYMVEKIADKNGMSYFIVITTSGEERVAIDAQELKAPTMNSTQKIAELGELEKEMKGCNEVMARCAGSAEMIEQHSDFLKESLQLSQVRRSGLPEAEGHLIIMEGWAAEKDAPQVEELLDKTEGVIYFKDKPTPDDNPPVLLKNKKFASPFEFIGSLYSLPVYGSMDLTAYFAPFYMLFFGFCLGDAGYGLILTVASFFVRRMKGEAMKKIANLTLLCGLSTMVVGFLVGSFFGIQILNMPISGGVRNLLEWINGENGNLFYIALALGGVQIIFGMILNVINTTRRFGFKYSLGALGWLVLILACVFAFILPEVGVSSFTFSSIPFYIVAGVGALLMLFLNNPNKNPLINLGSGLWNTYNNVTGLLGDVLSYIRLFALCLSGGALALVFNDLAFGLAPDIPVIKQIFVVLILLFGHGINLFMAALGAFVHPMRLTFVEFYKNAGFEATERLFIPFKKQKN